MTKKISPKVTWVGKVDWDLKHFHGDELSTHHGSSYNSYLIRDKKIALIDTVWQPFAKDFVANLKNEIDLHAIDFIIMNHNEIDHSGALPELMAEIPDTPIYCTKKGEAIIRGHYHQNWHFINVATGDTLNLGDSTLTFVEMSMLHWPDSMLTYMSGDNIVFSNDAFGQHFAADSLFNDTVDKETLMYEAMKYFANILNTYSSLIPKKIQQILSLNLPMDIICPSHGLIWRENPKQIIDKYLEWASAYAENQVTIVYDTMWQSTHKMAAAIADGIREITPATTVKIMCASEEDKNDILTEIFRSKAVLVGSPTINYGISYAMAGLLEMMRGLKFKNKKAAAFGSYGWSGDAVKQMNERLKEANFEVVNEGISKLWVPDQNTTTECIEFGRKFAESL